MLEQWQPFHQHVVPGGQDSMWRETDASNKEKLSPDDIISVMNPPSPGLPFTPPTLSPQFSIC